MSYTISTTKIDLETGLTQQATLTELARDQDWTNFYEKIYAYTLNADDAGTVAMWLLPVPGPPINTTFSAFSMKVPRCN